jgi:hypothetical protein
LPLVVIAIASTGGHLVWLALPLCFLFVERPFVWRSSSRGRLGRGSGRAGNHAAVSAVALMCADTAGAMLAFCQRGREE